MARDLAHRDPLTGVKSRHAYIEKEKEMDALVESGQAPPFAVAVLDVNGLKQINDTYGHKAGDQQICSASKLSAIASSTARYTVPAATNLWSC